MLRQHSQLKMSRSNRVLQLRRRMWKGLMLVKARIWHWIKRMTIWTRWSLIRNSKNFSNSSRCVCRLFTTSRRIAACWAVRKVVGSLSWDQTYQTCGFTKSENAVRISPLVALQPRWNLGMNLTSLNPLLLISPNLKSDLLLLFLSDDQGRRYYVSAIWTLVIFMFSKLHKSNT